MAGLFNFEHYYTEKNIKTDIALDISDISVDDSGPVEYVTNNVMYKITAIVVNGAYIDQTQRIHMVTTGADVGDEDVYFALGYPLDELVEAGVFEMPESADPIQPFTLSINDHFDEKTIMKLELLGANETFGQSVYAVSIGVTPRVRWMNPSMTFNPPATADIDQQFWQLCNYPTSYYAMAVNGLLGSVYKGKRWYNRQPSKNPKIVFGYDNLVRKLNNLNKTAKENNLGIKVTYFDTTYAHEVEAPESLSTKAERRAYAAELRKADWTATSIKKSAKYLSVYPTELEKFVNKCNAEEDNPLETYYNDTATAVIPNVADAFKKLYESKEDLADEFTDKYMETYKSIMSISGVRPFMSRSLRTKLSSNKNRLKKTELSSNRKFALDLASCVNYLKAMYRYPTPWISYGLVTNPDRPNDVNKYGIRLLGNVGFESIYMTSAMEYDANGNKISGSATSTPYAWVSYKDMFGSPLADKEKYGGRMHAYTGYSTYVDWKVSTTKMKFSDIKQQLADYYMTMYNQYYDLDVGDPGYISSCEYNTGLKRFRMSIYNNAGETVDCEVNTSTDTTKPNDIPSPSDLAAMTSRKFIRYFGSVAHYADSCMNVISTELARSAMNSAQGAILPDTIADKGILVQVNLFSDDTEIEVIEWDSASVPGKVMNEYDFEPNFETLDDLGQATTYTAQDCADFIEVMEDAVDTIDNILTVQGRLLGPVYMLIQKLRLRETNENLEELKSLLNQILWYQKFTNESVFDNKTFIIDGNLCKSRNDLCPYLYMPARFMVPVKMYKRVRVKYKRWGRTRHKTVKRSIGVRWAEIVFVDNDVYEAYPQVPVEPRDFYAVGKEAAVTTNADGTATFTFDTDLEGTPTIPVGAITKFDHATLQLVDETGREIGVNVSGSMSFTSTDPVSELGTSVTVYGIYVPLEPTAPSGERTRVRIEYSMPYIPYDSELKHWAFVNYGAFDQDQYANEDRNTPAPEDKKPGWLIFNRSSKRIGDLRAELGIYDAVSSLLSILRNTFGKGCVELVETMRSKDDQDLMCAGGGESTFLSWHNYGLAAKILINDPKTGLPIEDGSPDMLKLADVADAFAKVCRSGTFGKPLNMVWCGRLKIGANNFVWEFLPIGVGHKDAPKFREAILNQEDPVASVGFVNVDAKKLVYTAKPSAKVPYILSSSDAYNNAIVINGQHYVSPESIRNYRVPHDIVLRNVLEFCKLVRTKMEANGTQLNDRASMYEWKALNEKSYKQLLLYYGLTGGMSAARTLVCGDYVEMYQGIIDRKYSENVIEMVKEYLGDLYKDAKIFIEDSADGGAWLSLSDGRLHLKSTNVKSIFSEESKDNFYGEKVTAVENTVRGLYYEGVFRTEEELAEMGVEIEYVSKEPFIEGYDEDGNAVSGDALLLHSLIATQIREEFDKLREQFENYGGALMYDHFADGPNVAMTDMLENEFGLIAGQDLIDTDNLKAIFTNKAINDESVNGGDLAGGGDVFEKVVSNAEMSGVRKASLTKEHINVTVVPNNMTTEQLYKVIMKGSMTQANDMFQK